MQTVRSTGVAGPSPRCSSLQLHPVLHQQQLVHCRPRHRVSAANGQGHAWAVASAAGVVSTSEATTQQRQPASAVRRLILLRHADSETSGRLRDYDRPISMQGKREAAKIAQQLISLGWVPDLIIASNSKRTKQTLDIMVEASEELALVSQQRATDAPAPVQLAHRLAVLAQHPSSQAVPWSRSCLVAFVIHAAVYFSGAARRTMCLPCVLQQPQFIGSLLAYRCILSVLVCGSCALQVDAHYMGSLYTVAALDGQTKHHLEETIRSMATDAQHFCVMCVGHNKGWEEVSSAAAAGAGGCRSMGKLASTAGAAM